MAKVQWTKTDQVLYNVFCGVFATGVVIMAVSHLIEACRSRPKVLAFVFGARPEPEPEPEPESSSAAE